MPIITVEVHNSLVAILLTSYILLSGGKEEEDPRWSYLVQLNAVCTQST
jgi:hypothetical protein